MGPQNAVIVPASTPVVHMMERLLRSTGMPMVAAYASPKSKAFSGFTNNREASSPADTGKMNHGMRSLVTPTKEPIPHSTKPFSAASVLATCNTLMIAEQR